MAAQENNSITVETNINGSVSKAWEIWNDPNQIPKWNPASDQWHTSDENNAIKEGVTFHSSLNQGENSRMELEGTYDEVKKEQLISYTMPDGRKVKLTFEGKGDATKVKSTFDTEEDISHDSQKRSWQEILDSFKNYVESKEN